VGHGDEYNYDILERSFYFATGRAPLGRFSASFLAKIAAAFKPTLVVPSTRVDRTVK
jgi:hypothetical protein